MAHEQSTIGNHVRRYRVTAGWSQDQLGHRVGLKSQTIDDIETGHHLPDTAVALRLAREFDCRVEDLFCEITEAPKPSVTVLEDGTGGATKRLSVAKVRDRLVGIPLDGQRSLAFGFRGADAMAGGTEKSPRLILPAERLGKSILLMGCDPAFEILSAHMARRAPEARVQCFFASSHRALENLAAGNAHIAGTHLHNTGKRQSNVVLANRILGDVPSVIVGYSLIEEGLLVARGNPMGIRNITDLAQPGIRFANREQGAALRILFDDLLKRHDIPPQAITGYAREVASHAQGAFCVAFNVVDAALGFRAMAGVHGLDFVPLAAVRCDLVIPMDLMSHPTIEILSDILQSRTLRQELGALPGYDAACTGGIIAKGSESSTPPTSHRLQPADRPGNDSTP
jgi:molybdopterin molybdotransferase/putative molybdopterin biosynthesis protein